MQISELGFLRIFLAGSLLVLGLTLRFVDIPPGSSFGLGLPWTYADPEIWKKGNRRFGELLLGWWAWTVLQLAVGFPEGWIPALWAPLVIVTVGALSYPARLYQRRYHTLRFRRARSAENPAIPGGAGWPLVILREILPLTALLVPILVVRELSPELPERIPVRWDLVHGPSDWRWKSEALDLLRHQTMTVYLTVFLLEGAYLIWKWIRGARRDMAKTMLTRSHWHYYMFKLGWVLVFSGINLAFVIHARGERGAGWFLVPGAVVLGLLGALLALQHRRAEYAPPAGT